MIKRIVAALVIMLALFGAQEARPEEAQPVARVNGADITQVEFDRHWTPYIQQLGIPQDHAGKSGQLKEFRQNLLNILIGQELLYQDAGTKKLQVDQAAVDVEIGKLKEQLPSEEAFEEFLKGNGLTAEYFNSFTRRRMSIDNLIQKEIAGDIEVTPGEINDFYTTNPQNFAIPEQVRARHILIKVEETAEEAVIAEAEEKIVKIRQEAISGADFTELAKKHSEGPSGPRGGDLGLFPRGQMVKPFEEVAFTIKPGEISEPVRTQFGFHLIKVEEHQDAGAVSEEEAAGSIIEFLTRRKVNDAVMGRVNTLRESAEIEIFMDL